MAFGKTSSSEIMPRVQSPEHAPSCVLRSGAVDSFLPARDHPNVSSAATATALGRAS
jgi:hypothetical protein